MGLDAFWKEKLALPNRALRLYETHYYCAPLVCVLRLSQLLGRVSVVSAVVTNDV